MLFLLVNKQVRAAYSIERARTANKNLSIYNAKVRINSASKANAGKVY